MIGDPEVYDLLHWYDEDFRKIFKIKADFDSSMNNTDQRSKKMIGFIARISSGRESSPLRRRRGRRFGAAGHSMGRSKEENYRRSSNGWRSLEGSGPCGDEKPARHHHFQHVEQANADGIERVTCMRTKSRNT